jgi:Zn-dependent M32 family carboxypeptidase
MLINLLMVNQLLREYILHGHFMKNLFSYLLNDKESGVKVNKVDHYLPVIKEHIEDLVREIFNESIPFSQTKDIERCKYCPYASVCHKEQETYS